jgi:hypothetical protein
MEKLSFLRTADVAQWYCIACTIALGSIPSIKKKRKERQEGRKNKF